MDAVLKICGDMSPKLQSASTVVVKSTLPLGGLSKVETLLAPYKIGVVYNPEFLRQGSALADFLAPDRIVIGSRSKALSEKVSMLFDGIPGERIITDGSSAELIKLASNSYLAMRLSFANEIAALSEGAGASFTAVARGVGLDSRIGLSYFKPGPGWGGSCLPKDCSGLIHSAALLDIPTPLLSSITGSNRVAKRRVVEVIREMLGGQIRGKTVAIWGVAFKAGTDDMRGSPSLEIIDSLESEGATVKAYEPSFCNTTESSAMYSASALDAVRGADALLVLSESEDFRSIPAEKVHELMRSSQIFDVRGVLDGHSWTKAVAHFKAIGESA
jgi:UDPglucose 6-dehydrogenase